MTLLAFAALWLLAARGGKGGHGMTGTTGAAPRAAAHGHVRFDRDRGLPHLRPHDDARDRHARVAVSV